MKQVVVIGGGVVGISCALSLLEDGHAVTVLDPGPVGEAASWASCGCIAVGEVVPLSQPGMLLKVPGWLMDSEAPLALRPASLPGLLPWFARFTRNATPTRMREIGADLARLTFLATDDFKAQTARYGIKDMLVENPVLKVFDGEDDREMMRPAFEMARELGCTIEEISGQEAHEMEPAIAPDFKYVSVLRDWSHVADTKRLVVELHRAFEARGGRVKRSAATGFNKVAKFINAVRCSDGTVLDCDELVLAAGTGSKQLSRELGVPIPLEGLAGYCTALSQPNSDLKHTVFYPKGGFGLTPHENYLSVAGTIEFAGLNAAPNWRRAEVLVERAHRVLPGLDASRAERRMGRRPFMPDTRPVIGRSGHLANLCFATGHGQLGLTLGATTGRLVADIVAERPASMDLTAFSPDRF